MRRVRTRRVRASVGKIVKFPDRTALREQAYAWLVCIDEGLSAREQEALSAWVASSPEHSRMLIEAAECWELALQFEERAETVDHLVIQVGGGALARAVAQAIEEAYRLGLLERLPRIHVCQPEGGFPFVRAYLLALSEIDEPPKSKGLFEDPTLVTRNSMSS